MMMGSCIVEGCADPLHDGLVDPSGTSLITNYMGYDATSADVIVSGTPGFIVRHKASMCAVQGCVTAGGV